MECKDYIKNILLFYVSVIAICGKTPGVEQCGGEDVWRVEVSLRLVCHCISQRQC